MGERNKMSKYEDMLREKINFSDEMVKKYIQDTEAEIKRLSDLLKKIQTLAS